MTDQAIGHTDDQRPSDAGANKGRGRYTQPSSSRTPCTVVVHFILIVHIIDACYHGFDHAGDNYKNEASREDVAAHLYV